MGWYKVVHKIVYKSILVLPEILQGSCWWMQLWASSVFLPFVSIYNHPRCDKINFCRAPGKEKFWKGFWWHFQYVSINYAFWRMNRYNLKNSMAGCVSHLSCYKKNLVAWQQFKLLPPTEKVYLCLTSVRCGHVKKIILPGSLFF